MILEIFLFALIGYCITSVITESMIFKPIRTLCDWINKKHLGSFIRCQLCVSIWVSLFLSIIWINLINVYSPSQSIYLDYFLSTCLGSSLIMFMYYFENYLIRS